MSDWTRKCPKLFSTSHIKSRVSDRITYFWKFAILIWFCRVIHVSLESPLLKYQYMSEYRQTIWHRMSVYSVSFKNVVKSTSLEYSILMGILPLIFYTLYEDDWRFLSYIDVLFRFLRRALPRYLRSEVKWKFLAFFRRLPHSELFQEWYCRTQLLEVTADRGLFLIEILEVVYWTTLLYTDMTFSCCWLNDLQLFNPNAKQMV